MGRTRIILGHILWTIGCAGAWLWLVYYVVTGVIFMIGFNPASTWSAFVQFHLGHMAMLVGFSCLWLGGMRLIYGPDYRQWP